MDNPNNPHKRDLTLSSARPKGSLRQLLLSLGLVVGVLVLTAQSCDPTAGGGPIPQPPGNPTPCPTGNVCTPPPPVGPGVTLTPINRNHYSFYYDNRIWQEDSSNSGGSNETLTRQTDYGTVSAQFFGIPVASGTTASQLLSTWTSQHLDPNKFTALQDTGPVPGAEIGFNAGAGETYQAVADLANAPNTPLYIELLSSVKGTTGIVFAVVSPLDPTNPDPNSPLQVRNGSYDHLINTLTWT